MEEPLLRAQAHAVLDTMSADQLRQVLDFCLDLREEIPATPDPGAGLERLLEEPA